jgi:stearoyl-CoA desaturase (delta-9 desaturase)
MNAHALPTVEHPRWRKRLENLASTGIVVGVQLLGLAALLVHPTALVLTLAPLVYVALVFGIVAGYHRGLSHRAYETSRPAQFALAWLGTAAMQNGPVWWVSWHRTHHRFSDQPRDPHSPVQRGVLQAHIGWVLDGSHDHPDLRNAGDVARFAELRWLDRWKWVPVLTHGAIALALFGLPGFVWVFALPTTLAFHAPLFVNSLGHVWGSRRYATHDGSRNNLALAVISLGDGWHNNHHHSPRSARAGERWWEIDPSYAMIRVLAALGLVWNVHTTVRGPTASTADAAPSR